MDTDSFIIHVKREFIYKDVAEDVEKRFDTSNYEIYRPLTIKKIEKVIGLMKDELGIQNMKQFLGLRAKTYSYLKDNNDEDKKAKGIRKCVIKRKPKFRDYKKYLKASRIEKIMNYLEKKEIDADSFKEIIKYKKVILKIQQRLKSERHNVFTE